MRQRKNSLLLWLLALNVLAFVFFGGRYWYSAVKERQEQHKQALNAAGAVVRMSGMNITDATKLMNISTDSGHGAKISDADLDWCLDKLKGQEPSSRPAASRRQVVDMTLSDAVKGMDQPQKDRLFQALVAQMTMDDSREEIGIDIATPARLLGQLGDKRAIAILQPHLNDPRPHVHQTVQKAINRLEGKIEK